MDTESKHMDTNGERRDSMKWEIGTDIYISAVYVTVNHTIYKYYIV